MKNIKKQIDGKKIQEYIGNILRGALILFNVIGEYEEKFVDDFGEKIQNSKRVQIKANGDTIEGVLTRIGHKYVEVIDDANVKVRIRAYKIIWVKDVEEKKDAINMP